MYILRKSFGPLSAGTCVDLIERKKDRAVVRLVSKPSEAMLKQKHELTREMGNSGIFTCPVELLVERRERKLVTGKLTPNMISKLLKS